MDERNGRLWLALMAVACLWVVVANGGPLYYFDSGGYFRQGTAILNALLPSTGGDGGGAASGGAVEQASGSRAPVYAVLVAGLWRWGSPLAVVALNLAAILTAAWFAAAAIGRTTHGTPGIALLVPALAVALLSSLPFYVAYVMPDIFAGVLLLAIATLAAFAPSLRRREILLAFGLLALSVVVHRSHLLIAGLMVPVVALAAAAAGRGRWWVPAGLVALAALVGVVEMKAYSVTSDKAFGKVVVHSPFVTARLVADGPGHAFLLEHCPDPEIPTCALAEALGRSDDPMRLSPSHIVFETSERLGSYRLLSPADQRRVSEDQRAFLLRVIADRPGAVAAAILRNTGMQLGLFSVEMTLPTETAMNGVRRAVRDDGLAAGRLAENRGWIGPATEVQGVIYLLSLGGIAGSVLFSRAVDRRLAVFALVVVAGIVVNALVCGAISQPANRYGARVAWLLPVVAMILALVTARDPRTRRPRIFGGGRAPAE